MASKPRPPPAPPTSPSQPPPPSETPPPPPESTPSSLPSLDLHPGDFDTQSQRTGAKSSKDSLSSIERRRKNLIRLSFGLFAIGVSSYVFYLGREWSSEELQGKKMNVEDAPSSRWGRMKSRFTELFDFFIKPQWSELLPPPLPPHIQKPYTLILSIDDLLVSSTWDRRHGWRTAKRPGVDYFLAYLSQFYEIVIFTSQPAYTAVPIIQSLDRYSFYITHRLFREATRYLDGKIVKDLSYLNRDLSKVIMLETNPEHVTTHPENSIVLPKWQGDPGDKGLVALIPFLESIAIYNAKDVRPILQAYHGKDIPLEYARKEAEAKRQHIEELKSHKGLSTASLTASSLFGWGRQQQHEGPIPPTYLEQKRREAQMRYYEETEYMRANKDELERLLEEDRLAQAREMSGSLINMLDSISGKKRVEGSKAEAEAKSQQGVGVQASGGVVASGGKL